MFRTIRSKLLWVFLCTVFVCVISSFISFWFIERTNKEIYEITGRVDMIENLLLKDVKTTGDFFFNETINPSFFISGKSKVLDEHYATCTRIRTSIDTLIELQQGYSFEMNTEIEELRKKFNSYQTLFDAIVKNIQIKGFKDFGIEGKMRDNAHLLERFNKEIGLGAILQLRRHEKDYIIRQDDKYIEQFLDQYLNIRNLLRYRSNSGLIPVDSAFISLENYKFYFDKYILYEKKIGLKNHAGMKRELDILVSGLDAINRGLVQKSAVMGQGFLSRMKLYVMCVWSLFVFISIGFVIIFSDKFSRSIVYLKDKMEEFVRSDFTTRAELCVKDSVYELDTLANNFSIMEEHIVNQMNALKERNNEMKTFIFRASHDIKGPVSSIKALLDEAAKQVEDRKAREYFARIDQVADKQVEIIEELAAVLNIKEGGIEAAEVDAYELARECVKSCQHIPGFDRVLFSTNVSVTNKLFTDVRYLKPILKNILENSIRYASRDHTPRVSISMKEENRLLYIHITDNGIGIKEEDLPHIFDMFYRGTNLSTGTGLGLYIVKNAVQKLNGAIEVQSEEGKGAIFSVQLPDAVANSSVAQRIIEKKIREQQYEKEPLLSLG